jgi:hypothetical protein
VSTVAIIACDHGLGHVRRSVLNAEALHRAGAQVTLFAPVTAVGRVRSTLELDTRTEVEVVDFATETSPAALRAAAPRTVRWHERLPDLAGFDRVVADTLPEVLEHRPDAILVAQFLWHDVLEGIGAAARQRALELAGRAHLVIGSAPFAMPTVRALPGFHEVGLHVRATPVGSNERVGEDLLIAGGATDALRADLRELVVAIVRNGPGSFRRIHVDVELMPVDPPSWLRPAEHTSAMYDVLRAAVVRPGLGTVSELLARGARIHCVREPGNAELEHNARVVSDLGAGTDHGAPSIELATALDHAITDPVGSEAQRAGLRFDGADRTAETVLSHAVDRA